MTKEKLEEKILKEELLLEELYKKQKTLRTQITKAQNRRDKAMMELNKDSMSDMKWLIQNPGTPGHYEAMNRKLTELYGSEYSGPHASGYMRRSRTDYTPVQANFDFHLDVYDHLEKKSERIANCKHFVENYIDVFEPLMKVDSRYSKKFEDKMMVGFSFRSQSSGIDYLGYEPEEKAWYWFTLRYSMTNIEKKFKDFDEAIEFAFNLAQIDEDD